MCKNLSLILAIYLFNQTEASGQEKSSDPDVRYEKAVMGFGFGFDYGGIGVNLTGYPQKNIGIFAGAGYAFAGKGFNAGIKLRLVSNSHFTPFLIAMYGYNAAITVADNPSYNKLFYGPSAGLGFDIGSHAVNKGNFSFAIFVPFRSPDVNNYINELHNTYGVQFKNSLPPIGFSLGYKFIIY